MPSFAVFAADKLIQLGQVSDFHVGTVPLDLAAFAGVLRQVAQQGELREPGRIVEVRRRIGLPSRTARRKSANELSGRGSDLAAG